MNVGFIGLGAMGQVIVPRLLVLRLKDAIPVEGGLPIIVDGKLIGALGVSGGSSAEDEVCADAGTEALS